MATEIAQIQNHEHFDRKSIEEKKLVALFQDGSIEWTGAEFFVAGQSVIANGKDGVPSASILWSKDPSNFASCPSGTTLDMRNNTCSVCPPNTFFNEMTSSCSCVAGYYLKGSLCAACSPGTFAANPGSVECKACKAGSFARGGSKECVFCDVGKYSSDAAGSCSGCDEKKTTYHIASTSENDCVCTYGHFESAGACVPCPAGANTSEVGKTSIVACLCNYGFYMPVSRQKCEPCLVGMTCPRGSSAANRPRPGLQFDDSAFEEQRHPYPSLGFYAFYHAPLSVFECLNKDVCPGGGFQKCRPNVEGRACGRCSKGCFPTEDGCRRCTGLEESGGIFPTLPVLLAPPLIVILYRGGLGTIERWGSVQNCFNSLMTCAIMYAQSVALAASCGVRVTSAKSFSKDMQWIQTVNEFLLIFKPSCFMPSDFSVSFVVKLFIPIFVAAMFCVVFFASMVSRKVQPTLSMDSNVLFSVYGGIFTCFNIGIAAQAFSLLQCYPHPNGEQSLRSAPDVLCGSQVWQSLMGAAVPAILVFIVGYCCSISWACVRAPRRFHELVFRQRWKFLFVKFRPSLWWWSLSLFMKSLLLSLTTVFFQDSAGQFIWLGIIAVLYTSVSALMLPWRSIVVSGADSWHHCFLSVLLFILSGTVNHGTFGVAVACFPFVLDVVSMALLFSQHNNGMKACQIQLEQMCANFVVPASQNVAQLRVLPYLDIYTLRNAQGILARELGGILQEGSLQRVSSTSPAAGKTLQQNTKTTVIDV